MSNCKKILILMSGSIACYKACDAISKLKQRGFDIQIAASAGALKFIGEATLEGLTGKPVLTDTFAQGSAMEHIHAVRWADLILVMPATANLLNQFAAGLAGDFLGTLFLAHDFKKPFWLAPAMNQAMWNHPATQKSLQQLKAWGCEIIAPAEGHLACGEYGDGRLIEPADIVERVHKLFKASKNPQPVKVLITAGGTEEPIDGVRKITNISTGRTALEIADLLAKNSCDVHVLKSVSAISLTGDFSEKTFQTYQQLQDLLKDKLENEKWDFIIHAAAVSDFKIDSIEVNDEKLPQSVPKIPSADKLDLHLTKYPKLLNQLKIWSQNKNAQVISFKLSSADFYEQQKTESAAQFASSDWVISNAQKDLAEKGPGRNFRVFSKDSEIQLQGLENLKHFILEKIIFNRGDHAADS